MQPRAKDWEAFRLDQVRPLLKKKHDLLDSTEGAHQAIAERYGSISKSKYTKADRLVDMMERRDKSQAALGEVENKLKYAKKTSNVRKVLKKKRNTLKKQVAVFKWQYKELKNKLQFKSPPESPESADSTQVKQAALEALDSSSERDDLNGMSDSACDEGSDVLSV